jgi:hypothetical protein
MPDNYYPRHTGEQSPDSEELHIAWLEDRIGVLTAERDEARAALRTVAERQREACADYVRLWRNDPRIGSLAWHSEDAVRATPLVTEGEP